ncbi:MAG: 50S ribosomal protein L29 [Halobacteriales archaeon]|nr:50S ribosomal protein L29 [Halobacteriales archaeon]
MAMKPKAIRALAPDDRAKLLTDTRAELMHERGLAAMGGSVKNPGKIRDLRTTIARVLTVEQGMGERTKHAAQPASNPAGAGRRATASAAKGQPVRKPAKAKPAKAAKAAKAKTGGSR